jgi:hypothetical protein
MRAVWARLVACDLEDNAAEDSLDILPLPLGERQPIRPDLTHHSVSGMFALRKGRWKMIYRQGDGGFSALRDPGRLSSQANSPIWKPTFRKRLISG